MRLLLQGRRSVLGGIFVVLSLGLFMGIGLYPRVGAAQTLSLLDIDSGQQSLQVGLNTLWVVMASGLCFLVMVGLSLLNAGFCRQKNAVNLLAQCLFTLALTGLVFWWVGFGIMFGDGTPLFGVQGWLLSGTDNSPLTGIFYEGVFQSLSWAAIPLPTKFLFQAMLAAIAVGIVAGAMAERLQFVAFALFSTCFLILVYPVVGHWIWGNGWLAQWGFWDFAGATVVHTVGGWAAFVGTVLIGPRLGKYQGGESFALPGHNLPLAALGCLAAWLGWFGFNGGALLSANGVLITHIILVTNLAAAIAGMTSLLMAWFYFGKPDLSMMMNGIIGGLVGISGICRFVDLNWAVAIGAIAGVLVVLSVDFLDRAKIDDPGGGISSHLVCGIWGTVAIALFAAGVDYPLTANTTLYSVGPARGLLLGGGLQALQQLLIQLLGIATVSFTTILLSWFIWMMIQITVGLRVSFAAELKGLDLSEHGLTAYNNFVVKQDRQLDSPEKAPTLLPPS